MSISNYDKLPLGDPLTDETRKERRNLLAVSTLGIAIVKTGLIPTKISALGIEFSQADQARLLYVLVGVIVYFLSAFLFYSLADISRHMAEGYLSEISITAKQAEPHEKSIDDLVKKVEEKQDADYQAAQKEMNELSQAKEINELIQQIGKTAEEITSKFQRTHRIIIRSYRLNTWRVIFDFGLPVLLGLYAIITLLRGR